MQSTFRMFAWSLLCFGGLTGCVSQATPAKGQDTTTSDRHTAADKTTAASTDATEPSAAPERGASTSAQQAPEPSDGKANDQRGDGLRKASRPPAELITGGNVVYVFNFKESAVGSAARETCQRDSAGDPRAERECFDKARSQVPVESVRFVKDKSNQYWWVTYNRYKGNLLKWHRIQFLPGAETDSTISLSLIGKDKGIAPLARVPRALAIDLPNDYSIVIQDPELGAMAYDAKIGLMEAD